MNKIKIIIVLSKAKINNCYSNWASERLQYSHSQVLKFKKYLFNFVSEPGFNFTVDIKTSEKLMLLQTSPTCFPFQVICDVTVGAWGKKF